MLVIDNIEAIYSDVVLALTEVNMRIDESQIVVLLGNNGSGKSTTLKCISGVLATEDGELNEGKIELNGKRIDKFHPEKIARMGVCHCLQGHPVFEQLTTEENLLMGGFLQRDRNILKKDLERVYTYFPRLASRRNQLSGYLSGGEQQMLVIGRALMTHPRLLLLDEPSLGLAPMVVTEIFKVIKEINQEQKTAFLIAEQNTVAALSVADYGYILQNGRVILSGAASILSDHQEIKKSFMGSMTGTLDKNYYTYIRQKRTQNGNGQNPEGKQIAGW
jgi:branched-chain amino acid transport system ATP-binding protein